MEKRVNTGRAAARRTAPKLRSVIRAGQNEGMEKIWARGGEAHCAEAASRHHGGAQRWRGLAKPNLADRYPTLTDGTGRFG